MTDRKPTSVWPYATVPILLVGYVGGYFLTMTPTPVDWYKGSTIMTLEFSPSFVRHIYGPMEWLDRRIIRPAFWMPHY